MKSSVSAVVVTYNSAEVIVGLLDSLAEALADVDWRLFVADNGSSDATLQILEHDGRAEIVGMGREPAMQRVSTRQAARRRAGDAVLILNSDVRLMPGSGTRRHRHDG
jgi:glycosyltransferase involved in cell wall biosynthesis